MCFKINIIKHNVIFTNIYFIFYDKLYDNHIFMIIVNIHICFLNTINDFD